jgi:hypothetical protein
MSISIRSESDNSDARRRSTSFRRVFLGRILLRLLYESFVSR